MSIKMKHVLYYPMLLVVLLNMSCSRFYSKTNLTKTQRYLQSATTNQDLLDDYGYTELNPIVLRLSSELNYDQIIDEFINRFWKNGSGESVGTMQSFTIVEKLKIPIQDHESQTNEPDQLHEFVNTIYAYKIMSKDGKEATTLFFELKPKSKDLYKPHGFVYSMLVE